MRSEPHIKLVLNIAKFLKVLGTKNTTPIWPTMPKRKVGALEKVDADL